MEFNGYYPTTIQAKDPASPPSLPAYCSTSSIPSYSYPAPSQSYGAQEANSGVHQPIDAILESKYLPVVTKDPLQDFLTVKKSVLSSSAEDILGLIYERNSLKYENLRRITYESVHWGSQLRELGDWNVGVFKDIDKTRGAIEKEIAGLERERRMEEINCWRDITRLKGELRETMQDFNMEKRKEQFFTPAPN